MAISPRLATSTLENMGSRLVLACYERATSLSRWWAAGGPLVGRWCSALQLTDHRTAADALADLGGQTGDRAGLVGLDGLLHLHRLEHDDRVDLRDLLAVGDGDLDDRALHRGGDRIPAGRSPGLLLLTSGLPVTARRGGTGRETGRQHDLDAPAADLDGHRLPLLGLRRLGRRGRGVVRRHLVVELGLDPAGVDPERRLVTGARADEGRVVDDDAVEGDHRGHAVDDELVERPARALQGLGAVPAGHDELGDQRVEGTRDRLALVVAAVEPDARTGRGMPSGQGARGRHEVSAGVLGVDPELDRVALDPRVVVPELLAGGDPEHLPDQVQPGDLLRDRVLDLEPGVDLEERDRAVLA